MKKTGFEEDLKKRGIDWKDNLPKPNQTGNYSLKDLLKIADKLNEFAGGEKGYFKNLLNNNSEHNKPSASSDSN